MERPGHMERLKLPEPAGRLWVATRDIFRALEREERDVPTVAHLGGGTVLAARWGHRRSTDVDITGARSARWRSTVVRASGSTERTGVRPTPRCDPSSTTIWTGRNGRSQGGSRRRAPRGSRGRSDYGHNDDVSASGVREGRGCRIGP